MNNDKKLIYVIDDDESIRWVLEKALTKENFEVFSFETAESMLANLKESEPNLIISDIRMPKMSGIDMLEKLKKYPKYL